MRLSEQSYGYQKTIILNTGRHCIPFPVNAGKPRLSTVDALVGNSSGRRTIIRNDFTSGSLRATQGGVAVARPQNVPAQSIKRSAKGRIKSSTVAIYASVFVLIVSIIAVGYRSPEQTAANGVAVANVDTTEDLAVNDVVATDIAASVAQAADLAVAPNVAELAVSTRVQREFQSASADTSSISKPAIVQLSSASRNITKYDAKAGDTVQTIAAQFGLSANTIKWANNLTSDAIAAGSTVDILPVDGIVYTVQSGDTIDEIASKYKASAAIITSYNDLELDGLSKDLKIIIPDGVLPTEERPGYVAPVTYTPATTATYITGYSSGFSGGKTWFISGGIGASGGYAYGNCTSYVHWRRAQLGRPIGSMWGNAGSWATNARNAGYTVNRAPAAGAVIQDWGHVAIVEAVLPNGDLQLSEMNASVAGGGYNIVSGRILPASQVGQYYYIH